MKNLLSRRIMSKWESAGCLCALSSAFFLIVGLAGLYATKLSWWGAGVVCCVGSLGIIAAIMIWRRNRYGLLAASVLSFVWCVFALVWGWKGPQDLISGIPPFLFSLAAFLLFRSPERLDDDPA
ncbi:MAG: hypothetical protein ABL949_05425 [Fimbriimonadaceae bacterium]